MERILMLLASAVFAFLLAGCATTQEDRYLGGEGSTPRASMDQKALNREIAAQAALERLKAQEPAARALAPDAKGILVFPEITKAGFLVGGQYGTGVLFKDGRAAGEYRTTSASYGLQAGAQKFGYAMFFMGDRDIDYLDRSDGWEIGVGPSVTVVDRGLARSLTTTTHRDGVYVFFFEQKGLMAGLGIQGTKITRLR